MRTLAPLSFVSTTKEGEEVNMNKEEKERFVADLHERLGKSQGIFLVDYQGLNVESMNKLRNELRKTGAELEVIKNRLLKLASKDTDTAAIEESMVGPSAVTFAYEDVVAPAKVLSNFASEFKKMKIKQGQISGKAIDEAGIKRLADLPGRDVLLAQALSAMNAVPGSFVRVLNGVITQLLYALKAIEQQKSEAV